MYHTYTKEKKIKLNILLMMAFSMFVFAATYSGTIGNYNSTIYALSYKYGFIPRAFIGTIYQAVNGILPVELNSYAMAIHVTQLITFCFFLFCFYFAYFILNRVEEKHLEDVALFLDMYVLVLVGNFSHEYNFGRIDLYMLTIAMICVMLLISDSCIWLILPLTIIGMLIHEGYIFMFANTAMILLIYRMLLPNQEKRKKGKYIAVFVISAIAACGLLIYFEKFSHSAGKEIWDQVVDVASRLSLNGEYHKTLLEHEILGVDLSDAEYEYRLRNIVDLPVYLVCMLPFIIPAVKTWKRVLTRQTDSLGKLRYWLLILGVLAILPDFIFKCDFGRWTLSVLSYICVVSFALLAMQDQAVAQETYLSMDRVKEKCPYWPIFLVYFIALNPLNDVFISFTTAHISTLLNRNFLHLW